MRTGDAKSAGPTDFAPGIPRRGAFGDVLDTLAPDDRLKYVVQQHDTVRRPGRPHYDLRIGRPDTGLFSWAVPKAELPTVGKRRLAKQTEVHRFGYGDFAGRIGKGYGAGLVRQVANGSAIVTGVGDNYIGFSVVDGKQPVRYTLVRTGGDGGRDWIMIANRVGGKDVPGMGTKPMIRKLKAEDLDTALESAIEVQAKIDGASTIVDVDAAGKPEVYSVRNSVSGAPIVHTERVGLRGKKFPGLADTTFRAELFAESDGKALPFSRTSALLNSKIVKAIDDARRERIRLRLAPFEVLRHRGAAPTPNSMSEIMSALPPDIATLPESARDPEAMRALIERIRLKQSPQTDEGVVIRTPGGRSKHVFTSEGSGRLVGTFPGGGGRSAVGGLLVDFPGSKTPIRVGTGFTRADLADIVGRVKSNEGGMVRVGYKQQLPSGMLREPVYLGMETDSGVEKAGQAVAAGGGAAALRHRFELAKTPQFQAKIRADAAAMRARDQARLQPRPAAQPVQNAARPIQNSAAPVQNPVKPIQNAAVPAKLPVQVQPQAAKPTSASAATAAPNYGIINSTAARFTPQEYYTALAYAETGAYKNKDIRTLDRRAPGGSTAFGKGQITGSTAEDFTRPAMLKRFDPETAAYMKNVFIPQAKEFSRQGNMKGKLKDYNPDYDYGGRGRLHTPKELELYDRMALAMIGERVSRSKSPVDVIRKWRGRGPGEDPEYYLKVLRQLRLIAERRAAMAKSGAQTSAEVTAGLAKAEARVDRSPTPAQIDAGNYRKGRFRLWGMEIVIETPAGTTRSGTDELGHAWSTTMRNSYGYIRGTHSAADNQPMDVFIGPRPKGYMVFVVNQNRDSGRFDEHKVMLGFRTKAEAEAAYFSNYESGWDRMRSCIPMTVPMLKRWLKTGDTSKPVERAALLRRKQASMVKTVPMQILSSDTGSVRHSFDAEIADTPENRAKGLSKRASIPRGTGMVFDCKGPFWMKDCKVALDLLWLDKQGVVVDFTTMPVQSHGVLKTYETKKAGAVSALELAAGTVAAAGIRVGDLLKVAGGCDNA